MGAVNVCVTHYDYLRVSELGGIEGTLFLDVVPHPCTKGTNYRLDFLVLENPGCVVLLPFDVENLASERQYGLNPPVSPCFAEPPAESPSTR